MASYPGFDNFAPFQFETYPRPFQGLHRSHGDAFRDRTPSNGSSLQLDPTDQLRGRVERIAFAVDHLDTWDVIYKGSREGPFTLLAMQEPCRPAVAGPDLYQESFPVQPYPRSAMAAFRPRQPSPIETVASTASSAQNSCTYSPDSVLSDFDSDHSTFAFMTHECDFPSYSEQDAPFLHIDPCCDPREIERRPDMNLEISSGYTGTSFGDAYSFHMPSAQSSYEEQAPMESYQEILTPIGLSSNGLSDDDGKDSDYVPARSRASRTAQSPRKQQQGLRLGRSKITKRVSPRAQPGLNAKDKQHKDIVSNSIRREQEPSSQIGPFPCPLSPYGCISTFKSKNEWKRHIISQHLFLGFWRCDCCPDSETRPNIFNRKDLFTEHLRRMHHPNKTNLRKKAAKEAYKTRTKHKKTKAEDKDSQDLCDPVMEEFESFLEDTRNRCWQHIRNSPDRAYCVFCEENFNGDNGFDKWLEHVGQHLAVRAKQNQGNYDTQIWTEDTIFRDWLIRNGFLKEGPCEGQFVLVDDETAHEINMQVLHDNANSRK